MYTSSRHAAAMRAVATNTVEICYLKLTFNYKMQVRHLIN